MFYRKQEPPLKPKALPNDDIETDSDLDEFIKQAQAKNRSKSQKKVLVIPFSKETSSLRNKKEILEE